MSFATTAASTSTLQRGQGSEKTYRAPHLVGAGTLSLYLLGGLAEGGHLDIPARQQGCALMPCFPPGVWSVGRSILTEEEPSTSLCVHGDRL